MGAIRSLAVIGTGLIGTSAGLAARRKWPGIRLVEIDRDQSVEAARGADVILIATPVDVIIDVVQRHAGIFAESTVIDTGSTKRAVVRAARAANVSNFVGGHPMAGAASSGARDARVDLFDRRPWFLVPHGADAAALQCAEAFVAGLGALPVVLDDDGTEHDRVMAAVSHLPQVVASALMTTIGDAVGERGLAWAGPGLRDTTRLAASDPAVWASVLASNAEEIRPLLAEAAERLLAAARDLEDPAAVRRLFEAAAQYRLRIESSS